MKRGELPRESTGGTNLVCKRNARWEVVRRRPRDRRRGPHNKRRKAKEKSRPQGNQEKCNRTSSLDENSEKIGGGRATPPRRLKPRKHALTEARDAGEEGSEGEKRGADCTTWTGGLENLLSTKRRGENTAGKNTEETSSSSKSRHPLSLVKGESRLLRHKSINIHKTWRGGR